MVMLAEVRWADMIDGHEIAYGARNHLLGEQLRSFGTRSFACHVWMLSSCLVFGAISCDKMDSLSSIAIEFLHARVRVNCHKPAMELLHLWNTHSYCHGILTDFHITTTPVEC